MNVFSEDSFLDVFCKAYFPGQATSVEFFELEGRFWRLPCHNGKPIAEATFIDFFEPSDDKAIISQSNFRRVRYLARVNYGMVCCSKWIEQNLGQRFEAGPTVLWSNFESWDAFIRYAKRKQSKFYFDYPRRQRKLEREIGTIQFIFDDCRPEILETCFRWKSEYLLRNELPDSFGNPNHLNFLRELAARQMLIVSSLSAGEQLLAIHLGMLNQGRFYSWVTSYNSAYPQYSPGGLLFLFLLEESFRQKHVEYDFLLGGEDYKWNYATHARLIAEIGIPPFPQQLKRFLIRLVATTFRPFPGTKSFLRQLYNNVLQLIIKG